MKDAARIGALVACLLFVSAATAQDWPQWRGPNRDNKVTGFLVPKAWPKSLTTKWRTKVGNGVSSPVLVGDRVYAIGRQGGNEVIVCLDASSGKEVWSNSYAAKAATGAAGGFPGPRSTPVVAEGKVCTLGVSGALSCLDAASGKVVWRKETRAFPRFYTSSSPLIVEGKCVAFLGSSGKGELAAFDLTTGEPAWKWTSEAPAYGSPILMTIEGTKQIVTLTDRSLVGIGVADGKLLWRFPFASKYNSVTPVADGPNVICTGPPAGTMAVRVEKKGDDFTARQLWTKSHSNHQYNTPLVKDGLLYGLTTNRAFYCMNAQTGEVLWTDTGKRGQCGFILDAGPVLVALTSDTNLIAFAPDAKGYRELARLKVATSETWGCPILAGNRVFVRDADSVALLTID